MAGDDEVRPFQNSNTMHTQRVDTVDAHLRVSMQMMIISGNNQSLVRAKFHSHAIKESPNIVPASVCFRRRHRSGHSTVVL